ncbi:hypothetical protein AY533_02700 [Corynebacterium diphtheriae bv. gravis]|uniref:hypothetical protein n=1 Tax=Corynebacterium diphtheriae TaxID=1717 RepID=UPI000B696C4E|nr:hypothetical protein [Corynebacterium diphtheriae]OWN57313.1 hypothetical protein AY490_10350 [Corynebacterium diphtheriae bv. gravis]OWN68713.1 hypothetical protein AY513_09765 [Corynebacterium diphtheriae bv. gravis]OWN86069.1 hypothetical protein AY515_04990 [Corynebacterium diphtheriae bv. gravis]OWN93420.1 hypothetical protein AY533_02700 [Corynebacterium diphtheriae bv. gravis]OWN99191.1 hypothetical protein AY534_05370 [Corynebacterium diphtheriae bv. gravis]
MGDRDELAVRSDKNLAANGDLCGVEDGHAVIDKSVFANGRVNTIFNGQRLSDRAVLTGGAEDQPAEATKLLGMRWVSGVVIENQLGGTSHSLRDLRRYRDMPSLGALVGHRGWGMRV